MRRIRLVAPSQFQFNVAVPPSLAKRRPSDRRHVRRPDGATWNIEHHPKL